MRFRRVGKEHKAAVEGNPGHNRGGVELRRFRKVVMYIVEHTRAAPEKGYAGQLASLDGALKQCALEYLRRHVKHGRVQNAHPKNDNDHKVKAELPVDEAMQPVYQLFLEFVRHVGVALAGGKAPPTATECDIQGLANKCFWRQRPEHGG